ncbi:type II toxin-antitoxin system HicA family toxin [Streptomycetaceae bacterium NBC_01309]
MPNPFPSLKAAAMLKILYGLGYTKHRQNGSHCILKADGRPPVLFAAHHGKTMSPVYVRDMLVKQVGLSEADALKEVGAS